MAFQDTSLIEAGRQLTAISRQSFSLRNSFIQQVLTTAPTGVLVKLYCSCKSLFWYRPYIICDEARFIKKDGTIELIANGKSIRIALSIIRRLPTIWINDIVHVPCSCTQDFLTTIQLFKFTGLQLMTDCLAGNCKPFTMDMFDAVKEQIEVFHTGNAAVVVSQNLKNHVTLPQLVRYFPRLNTLR